MPCSAGFAGLHKQVHQYLRMGASARVKLPPTTSDPAAAAGPAVPAMSPVAGSDGTSSAAAAAVDAAAVAVLPAAVEISRSEYELQIERRVQFAVARQVQDAVETEREAGRRATAALARKLFSLKEVVAEQLGPTAAARTLRGWAQELQQVRRRAPGS